MLAIPQKMLDLVLIIKAQIEESITTKNTQFIACVY